MILVTGATGLLGGHLIAQLLRQYDTIIATKRKHSSIDITKNILSYYFTNAQEQFEKIKWIEPDFLNPFEIEEIITNYNIRDIYHCAGLVSFNDKRRNELIKTNAEITANVVNCCLEKDIKFCYVSSIAALLNQFEHNPINEKTFWQPGKYEYAYALSKYLGECEVWRGIEEGLKAVIVNPGIIVGAGNWNNGWGILVQKTYRGLPFYTTGITGYVAVEDVVHIMLLLMQKEIFGQRFIVIENNYSFKEILDELHRSLHKKTPSYKATPLLVKTAQFFEKIYSTINPSYEPNFTKATVQGAFMQNFYDNTLIKQILNYSFIPVKPYIHAVSQKFLNEVKK